MDNIKFFDGTKIYRVRLTPEDLLIISIPSEWYDGEKEKNRVRDFSTRIEEYLKEQGFNNPILVLPKDMSFFNTQMETLKPMNEIEAEMEGFEDVDWRVK